MKAHTPAATRPQAPTTTRTRKRSAATIRRSLMASLPAPHAHRSRYVRDARFDAERTGGHHHVAGLQAGGDVGVSAVGRSGFDVAPRECRAAVSVRLREEDDRVLVDELHGVVRHGNPL